MKKISKLFALLAASASLSLGFLACSSDGEMYDMSPKFWEVSKISLDGLYFRGSPNGWTTTALTKASDGSYSVEFQADADSIQFKFSDSDWTKSKTYAADVMSLGTAPSGVTLTAVDDNNGGFNAKLAGLTKDSKYKLTATPTNDSKLTISLASSNYTLFSLAGYYIRGDFYGWNIAAASDANMNLIANMELTSYTEQADHSLVYTKVFDAAQAEYNFQIASADWNQKFTAAETAIPAGKDTTPTVTMRERRINGSPKAYNTSTKAYVDLTKKVSQRVPKFNPFNKTGTDYEDFAKTYKSEVSVDTIWRFNHTGKTIVAADPYAIEDGSFAAKWNKLSAEQKAAYQNGTAAIDALVTASTHEPSDTATGRYGKGWVGKLTEYPENSYYPSGEAGTAGDCSGNAKVSGLTVGKKYKLVITVTTAGVVSYYVAPAPYINLVGAKIVNLNTVKDASGNALNAFPAGTVIIMNGTWNSWGGSWDGNNAYKGTVDANGTMDTTFVSPAKIEEVKEYEQCCVGLDAGSPDWNGKRLCLKFNVDAGNAKFKVTTLDEGNYYLYLDMKDKKVGDELTWELKKK